MIVGDKRSGIKVKRLSWIPFKLVSSSEISKAIEADLQRLYEVAESSREGVQLV